MTVESTGDGLIIIISCQHIPSHDWMSFAAWYSIRKNLPDANVVIICERGMALRPMFTWTYKCNVPVVQYGKDFNKQKLLEQFTGEILEISPTTMAVRDYDEERSGPVKVQSEESTTFVDYSDGCGKFVVLKWINRFRGPFKSAVRRYDNGQLTMNELKVLKMWESCFAFYVVI